MLSVYAVPARCSKMGLVVFSACSSDYTTFTEYQFTIYPVHYMFTTYLDIYIILTHHLAGVL